jgi:hypothetical protein
MQIETVDKVGTGHVRWTAATQRHLNRDPRVIEWWVDGRELAFSYRLDGDPTGIYKVTARQLCIDDLS